MIGCWPSPTASNRGHIGSNESQRTCANFSGVQNRSTFSPISNACHVSGESKCIYPRAPGHPQKVVGVGARGV